MRKLVDRRGSCCGLRLRFANRGRPIQENRPAHQGRRGGRQGTVEVSRRQDRRGRGQGPRRQAQQDLQHRAPGREGADFDDSKWESIAPETLKDRRSTGQVCFCWYRIKITIPPEADGQDRLLPDDRRRLRRDLGRRQAAAHAGQDGRGRSSPGSTSPTASSSRTPSRARSTRSRSSGSTGRSRPPSNWIFLGDTFLEIEDKK